LVNLLGITNVAAAGFICPFVPLLPVMCILINTYLLVDLG
jgi:solute carrier family 7 (cationic amino acid transporter), member 1